MKGIREIRSRIKAVKNTSQITRAMQLVAVSKMKRAQDKAKAGKPYCLLLAKIIDSLVHRLEDDNQKLEHPLLKERVVKHRGVLVIATDKGLCGALNANLFKLIADYDESTQFVAIGRKATQYLSRAKRNLIASFNMSDHVAFSEVRLVVEYMIDSYLTGKIDSIEVLYSRFINTLSQEPISVKLVSFDGLKSMQKMLHERLEAGEDLEIKDDRLMLFEPNKIAILDRLPHLFIKEEIYHMILDAKASEHSARMVAMKSATDNAKNLLSDLTLEYNKVRQAAITQEILEIAAATATL